MLSVVTKCDEEAEKLVKSAEINSKKGVKSVFKYLHTVLRRPCGSTQIPERSLCLVFHTLFIEKH